MLIGTMELTNVASLIGGRLYRQIMYSKVWSRWEKGSS